jgi:hypothetical protein
MIYFKSFLAGIAAALLVIVLFVVAVLVIPLLLQFSTTGSGAIGAVSDGFSELALVLLVTLAFAAGFYWEFRRASRRKSSLTH